MKARRILLIAMVLAMLLLVSGTVIAADSPLFSAWVLGAGGGSASGDQVTLQSTIGQPVAETSSNGVVTINAGYWHGSTVQQQQQEFLPYVTH